MTQRQHCRGTVLVIVVVIVMLLSLIAYKYLLAMQSEHIAIATNGDRLQAQQSAHSALSLLNVMLKKSRADRNAMGGLTDNPAYFAGNTNFLNDLTSTQLTTTAASPPPFGLVAYSLPPATADPISEIERASTRQMSGGSQVLQPPTKYGAVNESQKLNLLKLMEWEKKQPGAGVAALMSLPNMTEEIAEAILDWLDEDDEPRAQGAESEFYATLTRPVAPRNGLPVELDELLFVKGVSVEQLYGTKTKLPLAGTGPNASTQGNVVSSFASPLAMGQSFSPNSPSTGGQPWIKYLTIYSAERNESYTGQPRIDVNMDNLSELHSQLRTQISPEWADFVVLFRQLGPSDDISEQVTQPSEEPITIDFEKKPEFTFETLLDLIGTSVSISKEKEDDEPTVIASPAQLETLSNNSDLEQLFDLLTTDTEKRIVGRVNINDAPLEVLMALPGLGPEAVEAIKSDRERADRELPPTHPIWLLASGIVDYETMRALLPHVTCGGDVYRAEIWGRVNETDAMFRCETVLDASTNQNCRPVYYRERDVPKDTIKILTSTEFATLGITTPETSPSSF